MTRPLLGYIESDMTRQPVSRTGKDTITAVLTRGGSYGDTLDLFLRADGRWSLVQRTYGVTNGTELASGMLPTKADAIGHDREDVVA